MGKFNEAARFLANDPDFKLEKVTINDIDKLKIPAQRKTELKKLKKLYDLLSSPKSVEPKAITKPLQSLIEVIREDAEEDKADNIALEGTLFDKLMHAAEKLRDAFLQIDTSEPDIPKALRQLVKEKISDAMVPLSNSSDINPDKLTIKDIEKLNVDYDNKQILKKLKKLWDQLNSPNPVNNRQISNELEKVIDMIRNIAEKDKIHEEALKGDEYDLQMLDADILRDAV